jgi:2-keto-4-pentenoate hydratase/2-oxohepta-3-ene-1,7-dioic acid hydratase in catechol pathway
MTLRLVTYGAPPRAGLFIDERIYDAARLLEAVAPGALPRGMRDCQPLLESWDRAEGLIDEAARRVRAHPAQFADLSEAAGAVALRAPLARPGNIFFAGANYRDHVAEMARVTGAPLDVDPRSKGIKPWHAIKATGSTLRGPGEAVDNPGSPMLDWEIELAVVIGRVAKSLPVGRALSCVAGYAVANDLSAREHVARPAVPEGSPFRFDWIGQKSFDGSCPMGPGITPAAAVGDPMALAMKLWVNGELMQDSSTAQMIYPVDEQIAHLSARLTLLPGDVILTGTPAGVGMARKRFLQAGDTVRCWIERLGEFETPIR